MFDNLTKSLQSAIEKLGPDAKLTKDNMKEPMRDIRRALLEADVSLPVVRRFIKNVEGRIAGAQVTKGVTPGQQLVRCVFDELVQLMGEEGQGLNAAPAGQPQVVLMAGLQGVGKTTACGKLALSLMKEEKKVLMVATDVYRPAAIDQLQKLGKQVGCEVFEMGTDAKPEDIAKRGVEEAKKRGCDAVIIDTAGRLQVDDDMMQELRNVRKQVKPTDTLLVVDAMTGQEAAGLVKSFNDAVGITGAILTKLDGDSRGGAALSVREVSGQPIKYTGVGEKMEALDRFYPDRMARRILGFGDVLTLVEKAEDAIKEEDAQRQMERIMSNKFDFNDFLAQYKLVAGMGSMSSVMKMMPGMAQITEKQLQAAEAQFKVYESMINSMTPKEREKPELLAKNPSRRRRIAKGAGRTEQQVTELIGMFTSLRGRMKTMAKMMQAGAGNMGMNLMGDDEMMAAALEGAGPRPVASGKVRRKKKLSKSSGRGGGKGFGGR
ncbi:unnamed protein product [Pedinophyceae sp. YPF-701]|nr:unnamed protein product [Pedinophyceae sp. YPF-701]